MKISLGNTSNASSSKQSRGSLLDRTITWRDHARNWRALCRMDPHLLKDMGLTPSSSATRLSERWWIG